MPVGESRQENHNVGGRSSKRSLLDNWPDTGVEVPGPRKGR